MSEPQVWELPAEPPVGTTVAASAEAVKRYRRAAAAWFVVDPATDEPAEGDHVGQSWLDVLEAHDGRVVEVVPTPAQALAERLVAIARHLRAHPRLATVNVYRTDMIVTSSDEHEATALLAWAMSLGDARIWVKLIDGLAYTHVAGTLVDGRRVEVWDSLHGFREFLEERGVSGLDNVPLSVLGEFAESVDASSSDGG